MINTDVIHSISIEETDYIVTTNLTETEVETAKKKLIRMHVNKAISNLIYPVSDGIKKICASRIFFVQHKERLVLCGVYSIRDKLDPIGSHVHKRHMVYDYLLYSQTVGFYVLKGCTCGVFSDNITRSVSPSIYYLSHNKYSALDYGNTYNSSVLQNVYALYNCETYKPDNEKIYEIRIFRDKTEVFYLDEVKLFCDLPATKGYFLYTKEKNHMNWDISSKLVHIFSQESVNVRCRGGFGFIHNSAKSLTPIMASADNDSLRISDTENFYFYISRNNTYAFDVVMRCAESYGKATRMKNLFVEDESVNYKIQFPKTTDKDIVSFVFGVIWKSRVLYPVIMGCSIHDVIEVLCRDSVDNPYELPQHSIDEISANNIIEYIKKKYGELSNGEIAFLLAKTYGPYATASRYDKYWMYYHGESLHDEYLPTSVQGIVGEPIDGRFVAKLSKSTINAKWKSEFLLYQIVHAYYPDAIIHYSAEWLGLQHLDIFIPSCSVGIEYQGQQHYEANSFFGGETGFDYRRFLDEQKIMLCGENNVLLIGWPYTLPVTSINFLKMLSLHGIEDVPVPDPFNLPPVVKETITEEKPSLLICQFSLDGKFVNCFSSYEQAANACGISKSSLYKAAIGYNKTAGGYQWRRAMATDDIENIAPIVEAKNINQSIPIYQVAVDGEIIAEYDSLGKAERATGINRKSIKCVLAGTQKLAGGYYWIQKSDES